MRIRIMAALCVLSAIFSAPASAEHKPGTLVESAPKWNIGDTWQFRIEKDLDRTVTQGAGLLEISMRLENVSSTMSYTVEGIIDAEGERCYLLRIAGSQTITGTYSAMQLQGEAMGGSLVQKSRVEGSECRRTSDLAFVRAELRSTGAVELGGSLGGLPTPFQSHSITIANPPARVLRFPLVEGEKWRVSTTLSTTSSGSSTDSIVTTFNYNCEVLGLQTVSLKNGDTYECVAISQQGTQTTQSQGSGINIDDINGTLFFAPALGNRVKDEAEGEELLQYTAGEKIGGEAPEEMRQPEPPAALP